MGPSCAAHLARRARIILAGDEGHDHRVVAKRLRVSPTPACQWRGRLVRKRLDGLNDEPRPSTRGACRTSRLKRSSSGRWKKRRAVPPTGAAGAWPTRADSGIRAFSEVVGLYMNPPRRHRSVEFRQFLDAIDAAVPKTLDVPLITANSGTPKTALMLN